MNELADATARGTDPPSRAAPRPPRPGARAVRLLYLRAWLLATLLIVAFGVMWSLNEGAKQPDSSPFGAFVVAPIVALLTLPSLWLLRLFPERSPSTGLRFFRRLLLGAICGSFPCSVLAALTVASGESNAHESAGVVWVAGFLLGIVAGIADAMHLDAREATARERDDLPGS